MENNREREIIRKGVLTGLVAIGLVLATGILVLATGILVLATGILFPDNVTLRYITLFNGGTLMGRALRLLFPTSGPETKEKEEDKWK